MGCVGTHGVLGNSVSFTGNNFHCCDSHGRISPGDPATLHPWLKSNFISRSILSLSFIRQPIMDNNVDRQDLSSSPHSSCDYETSPVNEDLERSFLWPSGEKESGHGLRHLSASRSRIWINTSLWVTILNIGLFICSGLMLWSSRKQSMSDQDMWKATSYFCT